MSQDAFYMEDGEELLLKIRKHWFLVFLDFALIKFFVFLPLIVLFLFPALLSDAAYSITMMSLSAWYLLCIIGAANVWTNYYLDLWIVTDKRIVAIEQERLFHREVATMRMERIQDTTITTPGFFASFFNYGTLTVNTAGDSGSIHTFEGIPNPEYVKSVVIERVDAVTDRKSKLEFSDMPNPTRAE